MFIHPGLPNMNENMSRKLNVRTSIRICKICRINIVSQYTSQSIMTTVNLASFVKTYFLGLIFEAYRGTYIFVDKQRSSIWHEFIFTVEGIFKIFRQ